MLQIRQVIKYSMWKAAQFVIVQPSAIHLTVLIKNIFKFTLTHQKLYTEIHARVIHFTLVS